MTGVTRIAATAREHRLALPGDELVQGAAETLTHAVTVHCAPRELWPWLVQMGADRAGWYSYDWIDNGRRRSVDRIVPELQRPPVGAIFPALPGERDGFVLVEQESNHWLVLGWPAETGGYLVTWAFVLSGAGPNLTRLVVRVRASASYRFRGLPRANGLWLARLVHFVMQRRQLVGIVRRAERRAS